MEKYRENEFDWAEKVDLVKLQFTDLFGQLKMVDMVSGELQKVFKDGYGINRFALEGLNRQVGSRESGQEGERSRIVYLKPESGAYLFLPWESGQEEVARVLCDVCEEDGVGSWADSRGVFKRILKEAEEDGIHLAFDFQCDFYLFHTDDEGRPTTVTHEVAGYYDAGSIDLAESVRRDIMLQLDEAGAGAESCHHGLTPGQHSFVFAAKDGIETADQIVTFKSAVKRIAKSHGLHASFMPKPNMSGDGSGLHVGIRLLGRNGEEMKKEMKWFRGGILKHLREMLLFTNPLVNSYRRLSAQRTAVFQPEFPATVWEQGGDKVVRLTESRYRCCLEALYPDPSSNPYLLLSALVASGMDGIRCQYKDSDYEENPIFPKTLGEAIQEFEAGGFAETVFGGQLCRRYLEGKKEEWERFCTVVTDWEIKEYLNRC